MTGVLTVEELVLALNITLTKKDKAELEGRWTDGSVLNDANLLHIYSDPLAIVCGCYDLWIDIRAMFDKYMNSITKPFSILFATSAKNRNSEISIGEKYVYAGADKAHKGFLKHGETYECVGLSSYPSKGVCLFNGSSSKWIWEHEDVNFQTDFLLKDDVYYQTDSVLKEGTSNMQMYTAIDKPLCSTPWFATSKQVVQVDITGTVVCPHCKKPFEFRLKREV